ncbi:MAG: malonyl-ACP O-methyltransferase BioC [Candidatus Omnitrophica bacterium]|nr:malonyl-ACP O-methyltransferase BioC [Candidatus Omnitrophota bacterium]
MNKLNITNNFSRYAHLYDKYADVQNKAAFELINSLKRNSFSRILELGCGTGNYTLMLRDRFKEAKIKALDISEEMINVAQNKLKNKDVEFTVNDAERITVDEDFDLITSNACFQWLNDLGKALQRYAKSLQRGGMVYFSTFGPQTFCELNTTLKSILKESSVISAYFCNSASLKIMLKDNLKSVKINEVCYQENFTSLKGLLEKIKYSGIRGNGLDKKVYFSRTLLEKLEKAYLDRFGAICVTYQVFFCQGEKR